MPFYEFSERLEQHRHEQALELQKLKVEIDALLSGAIKLQEKEFLVLPMAWEKLDEAHMQISSLVSPLQQYTDVKKMSTQQLDDFLNNTGFTETQKNEIKTAQDKGKSYREMVFWFRLHKAKEAFRELQNYTARNGIFLQKELKDKLTAITKTLWSAVVSKEIGYEAKDFEMQNKGWTKIKEETEPLYKEIEDYIHSRLQSHGNKP